MAEIQKLVEEIKTLSVLELNELVKTLEETFGVSAAAATVVAGPAADAPQEVEKTEFDVVLTEIGAKKIEVIKAVREITALGLIEAKNLVEKVPSVIKEGLAKDLANQYAEKLKAAGATVELK
ncbi:MAG: 50S ribosomal protein L7/L12 [Clostridia bacterium]|nr:50S ribosomal protein L7/L12 [Clostridia bacterium]